MFPSLALFLLLFAGKAVCDDDWKLEEEDDDETFATQYLRKYNYLPRSRTGRHDITTAIKKFQDFYGLPVTGKLDEDTLYKMKKPRCGVPDIAISGGHRKRYVTYPYKWRKINFKYYLSYGNDMYQSTQDSVFARAFRYWSDVVPGMHFTRTYDVSEADFKISFGTKTHAGVPGEKQCQIPFDGSPTTTHNTLAHAYRPRDGRIHFDDDEWWTDTGYTNIWGTRSESLLFNAVHEIGHALGLEHSNVNEAVMYAIARKGTPTLHQDDIDGIRSLYAPKMLVGCDVTPLNRRDCGMGGISRQQCESRGCCFNNSLRGVIWCFHKKRHVG